MNTAKTQKEKDAHVMAVMGSSKDMKWPTPQTWFDYLNLEFGFTLDPCCEHETAKCKKTLHARRRWFSPKLG